MAEWLNLARSIAEGIPLPVSFELPVNRDLVHVPLHLVGRRGADLFAECLKAVS
jgi:hypothetical protein